MDDFISDQRVSVSGSATSGCVEMINVTRFPTPLEQFFRSNLFDSNCIALIKDFLPETCGACDAKCNVFRSSNRRIRLEVASTNREDDHDDSNFEEDRDAQRTFAGMSGDHANNNHRQRSQMFTDSSLNVFMGYVV